MESLVFLASLLFGTIFRIELFPSVFLYVHDIVLFFLVIYWAIKNKFIWTWPLFFKEFLIFVSFASFSLLLQLPNLSFSELSTSFLYLIRYVFYFMVIVLPNKTQRGLYGFGLCFAVIGFLQFILYPDLRNLIYAGWDPHFQRLFSTLLDPNFAGIMLALAALLGIAKKYYITTVVIIIALFLTFSRSSYLAFAAGLLFLLVHQKKLLIGILGVFILAIMVLPNQEWEGQKLLRTTSVNARLGNFSQGLSLFAQKPVFGWGFNTLRYTNCEFLCDSSNAGAGFDNSFIFVLATTGVFGFAAYLWFLKSVWLHKPDVVFRASLIAILVHSLFTNSQFYPWVLFWIWWLV